MILCVVSQVKSVTCLNAVTEPNNGDNLRGEQLNNHKLKIKGCLKVVRMFDTQNLRSPPSRLHPCAIHRAEYWSNEGHYLGTFCSTCMSSNNV